MSDRYSGVLNLAKPAGPTSHDVVARVRRIAGQRSVGHAGTLDPAATGVLVLLLGRATALSSYAMAGVKRYRAEIVFGTATTTDDAEGEVLREAAPPQVTPAELEGAVQGFIGSIDQVPPRFSAIRTKGKRAYVEARKGRDPDLPSRRVTIYDIDIISWDPPVLCLDVKCGSGTYIRALARDLGRALGSAAHLDSLVRQASGDFTLDEAIRLEELSPENLPHALLPADSVVAHLRSVTLTDAEAHRARHGGVISLPLLPEIGDEVIRLYSPDSGFIGLARPTGRDWHPFRVLVPAA